MNRYDRNLQIIYVAILMSTLIYAVVAWATTHLIVPGKSLGDELRDPVTIGLYSVAAGMFLALAPEPRFVTRRRRLDSRLSPQFAATVMPLTSDFHVARTCLIRLSGSGT